MIDFGSMLIGRLAGNVQGGMLCVLLFGISTDGVVMYVGCRNGEF